MTGLAQLSTALAGRYEIIREIGHGGMATVYLARDVRHKRNVALKLLSPELGAILGAERFLAEIQVTANLQHPNLLPLFDSGEVDGLLFYVMPYVEGESLRARLEREKQLPVNEAVSIAVAIAGALDYAHRHGVIHRDLKPENILMHEGQPVVADFGIALAVSNAGGNRITQTGLSLGTPQYMSPEQATGDRSVDGRTDIYSLGAVLYESLVGDPPHLGGTSQAVIAKVLTERPRSVRLSRPAVPQHVDATVDRALEKLPADRFATAHEFAEALQGRVTFERAASANVVPPLSARRGARYAAMATIALVCLALGAVVGMKLRTSVPSAIPVRFGLTSDAPSGAAIVGGATLDVSPDGTMLAFVGGPARAIYLRRMNALTARPLEGTAQASLPTFSPDNRWIAFATPSGVKKVSVDGGLPQSLTPSLVGDGLSWTLPDRIIGSRDGAIISIPVNGGEPKVLVKPNPESLEQMTWPRLLPDGKTVLFVGLAALQLGQNGIPLGSFSGMRHVGVVNLDGSDLRLFDLPATNILGMLDGYLVYLGESRTIMAVRFDARRRRVMGTPVPIVENIVMSSSGGMRAALSPRGTLVYQAGAERMQLSLVATAGPGASNASTQAQGPEARAFAFPRFSPDGRKIAVALGDAARSGDPSAIIEVWIYDVASRVMQKLTSGGGDRPEWTPDGQRVIYRRNLHGGEEMWWQRADGSAPAEPLQTHPKVVPEAVVSPDGRYIVYRANSFENGRDLWYRAMSGDTTSHALAATKEEELMPRFSPDGRWLAYVSTASSQRDVFVQRFPGPGAVVQISSGGGDEPIWSRDGRHLWYRSGEDFVMATIAPGAGQVSVTSRVTVHTGAYPTGVIHASWDIAPDGRLLVIKPVGEPSQIVVVHDWRVELRALAKSAR